MTDGLSDNGPGLGELFEDSSLLHDRPRESDVTAEPVDTDQSLTDAAGNWFPNDYGMDIVPTVPVSEIRDHFESTHIRRYTRNLFGDEPPDPHITDADTSVPPNDVCQVYDMRMVIGSSGPWFAIHVPSETVFSYKWGTRTGEQVVNFRAAGFDAVSMPHGGREPDVSYRGAGPHVAGGTFPTAASLKHALGLTTTDWVSRVGGHTHDQIRIDSVLGDGET